MFVYTNNAANRYSAIMSEPTHTRLPESEEQLVALLATLRVEPVEEADFESRFLAEFHDRVAREAVCCPARRHLFSHLLQMVDNFGRGRLAFGASALGLGVVAICFAAYPTDSAVAGTAATVSRLEPQPAPLLIPALSNDLAECTSIRVQPAGSTFDVGGVTITRGQHSTIIEVPNTQVAPALQRQGNYVPLPASSVRYAF